MNIVEDEIILESIVKRIVKSIHPEKIILFGSRSKGNYDKESDFDICVIKENVEHRRKCAQHIYKLLYGVGASIDIIVETTERFDEFKNNPFMVYQEIAEHGKVIYEKKQSLVDEWLKRVQSNLNYEPVTEKEYKEAVTIAEKVIGWVEEKTKKIP